MKEVACFLVVWFLASGFYVTWQQDTSKGPISEFEISRKPQGGTMAVITKVPGDARVYADEDPTMKPGNTYCYQVRSFNAGAPSTPSAEQCAVHAGVRIFIDSGQKVLISRRATTTSTLVSILVNADQVVAENMPTPPAKEVTVNLRPGIKLIVSRRATTGASTISVLVNQDEVVTVNGVKQ